MTAGTVVLVGCGQMGSAMLRGWLKSGAASRYVAVEPDGVPADIAAASQVSAHKSAAELPDDLVPDAVVFAVKPQIFDEVVPPYRRWVRPQTMFMSIAAGKTIAGMARHLGDAAIVRVMPNTPAAIGRAISVACATPRVSAAQRQLCEGLLAAIGDSTWIADEALMDAVTAVSGSGPAYVFLLIETLAAAGEKAGLPADLALAARQGDRVGLGRTGRRRQRDTRKAARERHQPRRHHARRPRRADGRRRDGGADDTRRRRRDPPLARAGELSRATMAAGRGRGSARPSGKRASNRGAARAGVADPDRIVDTAMALIAEQGWRAVSLAAVAEAAGLTTLQVYRIFPSKAAILAGLFRRIDEAVLAAPPEAEDGERPRDRLFDLLMRRFDALQPYREGLGRLRRELPFDPPSALCAGAALLGSMRWMLDGGGDKDGGHRRDRCGQADGGGLPCCGAHLGDRRVARFGADDGGARPPAAGDRALAGRRARRLKPTRGNSRLIFARPRQRFMLHCKIISLDHKPDGFHIADCALHNSPCP